MRTATLDKITVAVEDILPKIIADQEARRARTGRYSQIFPTHTIVPDSGDAKTIDGSDPAPPEPREFPPDLLPAELPVCVRVEEYDCEEGLGFVIVLQVKDNGQLWEKRINHGPEKYRDQDWALCQTV